MKTITKAQVKNVLLHAVLTLAFVTIVGTFSNILILLIGYIISLPHLFDFLKGYYMNIDNQKLWLLYSLISQTCCTVGCGCLLTHLGASAARFRLSNDLPAERISLPVMFASVGIGCVLHGLLCAFTARLSMAYLFFAGPVQYIARLLGRGDRSLFVDLSFQFPRENIWLAVFIYTALCFVGGCIGYAVGYRKKLAAVAEEEAERKRGTPPEKTWSPEDAEQVPFVYRYEQKK